MITQLTLEEVRQRHGSSTPRRQFLFARLQTMLDVFSRNRDGAAQPSIEVTL